MPAVAGVQQQREWLGKPCLLTSEQQGRRGDTKEKKKRQRKAERLWGEREDERSKGESIFFGEVGEGSVRLDYLLLHLILF